jgi:integrase
MQAWTLKAELAKGYIIHDCHKSLGATFIETGGKTPQTMAQLGHEDIGRVEHYSHEAEKASFAVDAIAKVVTLKTVRRRQ